LSNLYNAMLDNKSFVVTLPLDVVCVIADLLPTPSYTSLALTCWSMYDSLPHQSWKVPEFAIDCLWNPESLEQMAYLTVGDLEPCD
jgi:hypothetical protein